MPNVDKLGTVECNSVKCTGAVEARGTMSVDGALTVNSAGSLAVTTNVPNTSTATGVTGQIAVDVSINTATSAKLYYCYGTNLWARVDMNASITFN